MNNLFLNQSLFTCSSEGKIKLCVGSLVFSVKDDGVHVFTSVSLEPSCCRQSPKPHGHS